MLVSKNDVDNENLTISTIKLKANVDDEKMVLNQPRKSISGSHPFLRQQDHIIDFSKTSVKWLSSSQDTLIASIAAYEYFSYFL